MSQAPIDDAHLARLDLMNQRSLERGGGAWLIGRGSWNAVRAWMRLTAADMQRFQQAYIRADQAVRSAEKVIQAAESLLSEDGTKDLLSHYVVLQIMQDAIDSHRQYFKKEIP
jgi:hypothetical protein